MINIFSFSSILAAITTFVITVLLLVKGRKDPKNRIFAGVPLCGTLWGLGSYMASTSTSQDIVFLWWQIAYIGGIVFSPIFYFHFAYSLSNLKNKLILYSVYALGLFFSACIIFYRDEFFGALILRYNQFYWFYWPTSKPILYLLFYISEWWIVLGYAFYLLVKTYRRSQGVLKNQLKYFIFGSIVGWLGAEGDFLPKFVWNVYPYANFLIAVYPTIFVYAMLRYRLMDISVAITRTGIFIAVYTMVLGIPLAMTGWFRGRLIESFGANWLLVPLGLMAALATVGPFIYIFFQRRAEEALLKEQRRYQETLKQASIGMTRIRSLRKLLDMIAHIVTKTVRISYVAIYLYNKEIDEFVLQVSRDKGRQSTPKVDFKNSLVSWLILKRVPLIYEEIKRKAQEAPGYVYDKLEENMRMLTAEVVIPCFLEDRLTGFIVLGDKISGQIYTVEDLNVFQVLANQAALAIENAQFYDETKQMQEQIAHAEKMATIGTMADGLSHQINNRFYALSLIAGDTIDTIKMADTSNCTPEVKEMIKSISHALDRIQVNVLQGGEVVKGILKYTRKGNEGLEPLTLDQILDATIEMVQYKVKLTEIDIIRAYPKDLPKIKGNLVQLQEVFFNFIDNANDAMQERKTALNEPGYRGTFTVNAIAKEKGTAPLFEETSLLEITIQDNGMGIKKEYGDKVFTPFFTTKVSSRRGTGLGLYVIRKIIEDTHKGTINFYSEHTKGTTFIVDLPVY